MSFAVSDAAAPSGSWPMFRADPGHSGLSDDTVPSDISLLWKARAGTAELTHPVAAGGIVYAGSADGNIYALRAATGKEAWRFDMGGNVTSVPAVDGTSLYALSEKGRLCALDAETGEFLWEASMPSGRSFELPLTLASDGLYISTSSGVLLKCSVQDKGRILWEADAGGHLKGPVTVGGGLAVAVAEGGNVHAFHSSNGTKSWSSKQGFGGSEDFTPALVDGRLWLGTKGKDVFCLDASVGDVLWEAKVRSTVSCPPAVGRGILVLCTEDREAVALNSTTGDPAWSVALGANVSAQPVMAGGIVIVASDDGGIFLLDATDGHNVWQGDASRSRLSSPAVFGGRVVLTASDGAVLAFGAPVPVPPGTAGGLAEVPAPVIAASASLAVLGAAGACLSFTEFGKYRFLTLLFVPLYVRLKRDEVLDNYVRGQIHGYIIANPGDHYNSIRDALELSNGILAHHLKTLEREGLVQSIRDGMYRRFFPANAKLPPEDEGHFNIQSRILGVIRNNPGISQKEISLKVGVSSPTVNYHVSVLATARMIRVEKAGRLTHCYVVEDHPPS